MQYSVRSVDLQDSQKILTWKNHPTSLKYSLLKTKISNANHEKWFANRLKNIESEPFLIFSNSEDDLGYVRFDKSIHFSNSLELSISLNPIFYNQGIGHSLLNQSIDLIFEKFPLVRVIARVHTNNESSKSIFNKAQFAELMIDGNFNVLSKVNPAIRFVFRADASVEFGTGHTQRSLGLIEKLLMLQYQVFFIGDTTEVPWVTNKFSNLALTNIIAEESDFESDKLKDILILDSYSIEPSSPFIALSKWKLVVVIFDEATPEYEAHLKIHPGIVNKMITNRADSILAGPKFIPLRKSISLYKKNLEINCLVITILGGGIDQFGFTIEMSKILKKIEGDFVVNFFSDRPEEIATNPRFFTYPIGEDLDKIGNFSELVFCPASTTALEFLARGCAVGTYFATTNQVQYYNRMADMKVAVKIGNFSNGNWNLDIEQIKKLISSSKLRKKLADKSLEIFDLNGSQRILDKILSL